MSGIFVDNVTLCLDMILSFNNYIAKKVNMSQHIDDQQINYWHKIISDVKEATCKVKNTIDHQRSQRGLPPSTYHVEDVHKIHISNKKTKYKMKYGQQFKSMLEARDVVMEHEFDFNISFNQKIYQKQYNFLQSQEYKSLLKQIKMFLVQAVGNIMSADFKFLLDQKLEGNEAKVHASKNIMLNMHSIYRQTIKSFTQYGKNNENFKNKVNVQKLRKILIVEIDDILSDILVNVADSYPQAPITGGTPRMRQIISEVNRMDDENNDFIITSGIKISDFMDKDKKNKKIPRKNMDYTDFIMTVINKIIDTTQQNQSDERGRTIYQKFVEFSHHLSYAAQEKQYQKLITSISRKTTQDDKKITKGLQQKQKVCKYFLDLLSDKKIYNQSSDKEKQDKKQVVDEKKKKKIINFDNFWDYAKDISSKKQGINNIITGQKIPNVVKKFSRQQIESGVFVTKHSSIMRVLTKWAEYLEEIFLKPEEYVLKRIYKFKNIDNSDFTFTKMAQQKQTIIKKLKEEYAKVKNQFNNFLIQSHEYIGNFFIQAEDFPFVSNIARFTQTRKVSSKIYAILTHFMLKYTNILIHHLLIVGQSKRSSCLNLICFRVSDLLRSKLQCSETSFVSLLKIMQILDDNNNMHSKFKLVRIKNKLDEPSNNIMINYLFMGKIQCELQLSVYDSKDKQKIYHTFSHFVYQLRRGKFGSISDCAIMISQHDPLIKACKQPYYQEKSDKKKQLLKNKILKGQQINNKSSLECKICKALLTNQKIHQKLLKDQQPVCYKCILKHCNDIKFNEKKIPACPQKIKTADRKMNYAELNCQTESVVIEIAQTGRINMYLLVQDQQQLRKFLLKVDDKIIQQFEKLKTINFKNVDYIDIKKKIKQNENNPDLKYTLMYQFSFKNQQADSSPEIKIKKKQSLFDQQLQKCILDDVPEYFLKQANIKIDNLKKLKKIKKEFIKFRNQKRMIKSIKFKLQIFEVDKKNKQEYWNMFDNVCNRLVIDKQNNDICYLQTLRYHKYKKLELYNLKTLKVTGMSVQQMPGWMKECYNLKKLDFSDNNISKIKQQDLPSLLQQVDLNTNRIRKINISHFNYLQKCFLSSNLLIQIIIGKKGPKQLSLTDNKFRYFSPGFNQSLQILNLSNNKQMIFFDMGLNNSIKMLNITLNQQMTNFSSLFNQQLTDLYVKNTNKLDSFKMGNNKVKQLDLSNKKLHLLDLRFNKTLETLSINNNPQLKTVQYLPSSLKELNYDLYTTIPPGFDQIANVDNEAPDINQNPFDEIGDEREYVSKNIYDIWRQRWKLNQQR